MKLNPLPVVEITSAFASPILRRPERLTPDMATKVRQRLRAIMDYAAEHGVITTNPIPAARRRTRADRKNLVDPPRSHEAQGQ